LAKPAKKSATLINDPQRCEVCGTILTLYPNNFTDCPHCNHKVCRACWGDAWGAKNFSAEECTHATVNTRMGAAGAMGQGQGMQWDWRKGLFVGALGLVAIFIFYFLLSFFVF